MPKLPTISGKQAIIYFEKPGYKINRQKGSHVRMHHPSNKSIYFNYAEQSNIHKNISGNYLYFRIPYSNTANHTFGTNRPLETP